MQRGGGAWLVGAGCTPCREAGRPQPGIASDSEQQALPTITMDQRRATPSAAFVISGGATASDTSSTKAMIDRTGRAGY